MGLGKLYERCSESKEMSWQIGPLFRRQHQSKALGIVPVKMNEFMRSSDNAVLDAGDADMTRFAREHLNYRRAMMIGSTRLAKPLTSAMNAAARVKLGHLTITAPVGVHQKFGLRPTLGRP
jgi:hypothetical protein